MELAGPGRPRWSLRLSRPTPIICLRASSGCSTCAWQGLDALLDRLRAADIAIITDPAMNSPEIGHFARIHDPEGNAIEL